MIDPRWTLSPRDCMYCICAGENPTLARYWNLPPRSSAMLAFSARHKRAADLTTASNTVCRSKVERLMTLRTSAVARCCWSASSRSRASRATSVSSREELRERTAFGATRLLRAAAFPPCALGDLPPALDRRRIAAPRLRTRHRGEVRLAHWSKVRHNLNVAQSSLWGLKTRSVSKTEQILLVCFQKPDLEGQFTRLCGNGSRLVLCGVSQSQHEAAFDGSWSHAAQALTGPAMPFRSRAPHDEAHPLGHDGTNIMDHAAALTAQHAHHFLV